MMHRNIKEKYPLYMWIILILLFLSGPAAAAQSPLIERVAQDFAAHRYNRVIQRLEPHLKEDLDKKQLKEIWEKLEEQYGHYQNVSDVVQSSRQGMPVESATLHFEKAAFKLNIALGVGDKLAAVFIAPMRYSPPGYAQDVKVGKRSMRVKSDTFSLPGELIIPVDCNNCPLVILVQGSGAHDMDETIGPNKVFYDLAMGLATQGIASFRYEKRSKTYPDIFEKQFSIYDETVDDAVSAAIMLKNDRSFNFDKIIILGHSLGAYALPLIADSIPWISGGICFSANARRLEDLIYYQVAYMAGMDGDTSKDERKVIRDMHLRAQKIRIGDYTNETPATDLLVYWPGTFWKSIENYDPVERASNLGMPLFIMQGEKDYQITMVDFEIWEKALAHKPGVRIKSYPGLTHLFTPTESKMPGPFDYYTPAHVDPQVISDIAEWVKGIEN